MVVPNAKKLLTSAWNVPSVPVPRTAASNVNKKLGMNIEQHVSAIGFLTIIISFKV